MTDKEFFLKCFPDAALNTVHEDGLVMFSVVEDNLLYGSGDTPEEAWADAARCQRIKQARDKFASRIRRNKWRESNKSGIRTRNES